MRTTDYPFRPAKRRAVKASEKSGRKAKCWLSRNDVRNDNRDVSAPTSQPWWGCPAMKAERLRRAATRRS